MIVRSMKDTLHTRHRIGMVWYRICKVQIQYWDVCRYIQHFLLSLVFLEDEKMGRQILICIIPAFLFSFTTTSRPRSLGTVQVPLACCPREAELGYFLVLHSIPPYTLAGGLGGVVQRHSLQDTSRFRYLPYLGRRVRRHPMKELEFSKIGSRSRDPQLGPQGLARICL